MEKRLYGKPLMSVENFTPSEYVSLCWYIKEGDCYRNLYHDTQTTEVWDWLLFVPYQHSVSGYYDIGEALCENHGSHRVPAETTTPKWFKANVLPQPISNDNKYYTRHTTERYNAITGNVEKYSDAVTGNIYTYSDGTTTHYFKEPTEAGNHS